MFSCPRFGGRGGSRFVGTSQHGTWVVGVNFVGAACGRHEECLLGVQEVLRQAVVVAMFKNLFNISRIG